MPGARRTGGWAGEAEAAFQTSLPLESTRTTLPVAPAAPRQRRAGCSVATFVLTGYSRPLAAGDTLRMRTLAVAVRDTRATIPGSGRAMTVRRVGAAPFSVRISLVVTTNSP